MGSSRVLIADGHLDLATNALAQRRDLTQPVHVLRDREGGGRKPRSTHKDSLERKIGPLIPQQGESAGPQ